MSAAASRVVRNAFDVVAALQKVESLGALNASVKSSFEGLGYDAFVGLNHVAPGGKPDVAVLFGRTHQAWEQRYIEQGYQSCDAVIPVALSRSEPFFWTEVPKLMLLSGPQQRVFDEAAEYGLRDGLLVPMHNLDGSISSVLLTGAAIDATDPSLRAVSHLLAIYFGSVGRRLHRGAQLQELRPVRLTQRQIDCLQWVREGKSSTDIGEILNLSARTVDDHIHVACERLGVRTRVQAIAEAALRGLITL